MPRNSLAATLIVAASVCVVCSLLVSTAAVVLKPLQDANRAEDRMRIILIAAGLLRPDDKPDVPIAKLFEQIESRVVDLDTGEFVDDISPQTLNEQAELKTSGRYRELDPVADTAGIRRRENFRVVYFLRRQGEIERVILPVRGKGLWSTMYGLLALDGDCNTVEAMEFYAHGETPGLGGEIENERWKAGWVGKKIFDDLGQVKLEVVKNEVDPQNPDAESQIDGLSGATITSRGVTNLVRFWLGEQGYGPLIERLRRENDN